MLRIRYRLGMYEVLQGDIKNVAFKPDTTTAGKGKE